MKKTAIVLMAGFLALSLASCVPTTTSSQAGTSEAPIAASSERGENVIVKAPPAYSEESFQIHYSRLDKQYSTWALWIWTPSAEGAEYAFNGEDSWNGAIAAYTLASFGLTNQSKIGFIVKKASANPLKPDWDGGKDAYSDDRFFAFADYPADANGIHHLYLKSNDGNEYSTNDYKINDIVNFSYFISTSEFVTQTTNPASHVALYEDKTLLVESDLKDKRTFYLELPTGHALDFEKGYKAVVTFSESKAKLDKSIGWGDLLKNASFSDKYTYTGTDLGATYSAEKTIFKVWSPLSSKVVLKLYQNGTPKSVSSTLGDDTVAKEEVMTKGEKGVFSVTETGDYASYYYTYTVTNATYPDGKEVVDPYAKSAGVNGLRGMVVDFSKTNPTGWDAIKPLAVDKKALTIYETHVADLTSSSTWSSDSANRAKAKTFLGAALAGTSYSANGKSVKTGFDHVKELGVNAVELLPIFDQANDERKPSFNWGYNPLNYNCLEGSYSSNPYDGYARISEFKSLVMAYRQAGINVLMDVVYNHVNGAKESNFDVLCPGYYFRYQSDGTLYSGSGCGNETASDLPMMRKFIKESTAFWASEYQLGGFRFDLMALHDLTTMKEVAANLKTINPTIAVFGEPWTGGTSGLASKDQASQANGASWDGYGAFNDKFRDALIKGGLSAVSALSWVSDTSKAVTADLETLKAGFRGYTYGGGTSITDPDKSVNYVTCHDNYTLYDRFYSAGIHDDATLKKMAVLSNSAVFTSGGTSFMLAGEEFLRTKNIRNEDGSWKKDDNGFYVKDHNSYNASYEENALDYALKITNADVFASYQKLVAFKQNCAGLQGDAEAMANLTISVAPTNNQFAYELSDSVHSKKYLIVHNNGVASSSLPTVDFTGYSLYLDTLGRTDLAFSSQTTCQAFETIIAEKALA